MKEEKYLDLAVTDDRIQMFNEIERITKAGLNAEVRNKDGKMVVYAVSKKLVK